MRVRFGRCVPVLVAALFPSFFAIPVNLRAQEHVVPRAELKKDVQAAAQARQKNLETVRSFFSEEPARKALKSAHLPYEKVEAAVATLSDEELARLATRADQAQKDFVAGALTNQQITYIIIALATAVIILVLIKI